MKNTKTLFYWIVCSQVDVVSISGISLSFYKLSNYLAQFVSHTIIILIFRSYLFSHNPTFVWYMPMLYVIYLFSFLLFYHVFVYVCTYVPNYERTRSLNLNELFCIIKLLKILTNITKFHSLSTTNNSLYLHLLMYINIYW